jgi:anti-sigma-K factor RskA
MSEASPPREIPEEVQVLAGEYVLGVLDMAERRAVRRRAIAAAITGWEQRLAPLAGMAPPVAPPAALWERIERGVAPLPLESADPPHLPPLRAPAERLGAPLHATRALPSRRRVWPWQLATAASLALAAALALVAYLPGPAGPQEMAVLMPSGSAAPGFMAKVQPDGALVVKAMAPGPVPPGRDMELWMLPKGATTPVSLGVLPASGRTMMLPAMPKPGSQLMISLEPQGGSPTGAPTGPVLYAGTIATVSL